MLCGGAYASRASRDVPYSMSGSVLSGKYRKSPIIHRQVPEIVGVSVELLGMRGCDLAGFGQGVIFGVSSVKWSFANVFSMRAVWDIFIGLFTVLLIVQPIYSSGGPNLRTFYFNSSIF